MTLLRVWSSIYKAGQVKREGGAWRTGNERCVKAWEDSWFPQGTSLVYGEDVAQELNITRVVHLMTPSWFGQNRGWRSLTFGLWLIEWRLFLYPYVIRRIFSSDLIPQNESNIFYNKLYQKNSVTPFKPTCEAYPSTLSSVTVILEVLHKGFIKAKCLNCRSYHAYKYIWSFIYINIVHLLLFGYFSRLWTSLSDQKVSSSIKVHFEGTSHVVLCQTPSWISLSPLERRWAHIHRSKIKGAWSSIFKRTRRLVKIEWIESSCIYK